MTCASMKKILSIVIIAVVISLLGYLYYNSQYETEYYTVSVFPSSWYDNKKKVEVKKVKNYDSDSLAIEEQTNLYHYIQEMHNDRVEEAKKEGNTGNVMIFSRMRDEQRCLIKIVRKRSFNIDELKEQIIKYGVNSAKVENYCERNDVQLNMYPLLSDF